MNAVLKDGVIQPQEPVPTDWLDGTELNIEPQEVSLREQELEEEGPPSPERLAELDRWYEEMQALCAHNDPEDERAIQQGIDEHRQEEKARARKEAGLECCPEELKDDLRLDAAIQQIRQRSKGQARRSETGLSE